MYMSPHFLESACAAGSDSNRQSAFDARCKDRSPRWCALAPVTGYVSWLSGSASVMHAGFEVRLLGPFNFVALPSRVK